jgi:flagellar protein FliJ
LRTPAWIPSLDQIGMSRFRFRLEPVLQMRQRAEDQAQQALARAERQLQEAERSLRLADDRLRDAYVSANEAERQGAEVVHLTWHRNWIVVKTRDVEASRLDVRDRLETRDLRLQQAQEAHKQRRVLERFKERARLAFDTAAAQTEMQAIDELATIRAARRVGDFQ